MQIIYWDAVSGNIKPGNSDHFAVEIILGWVLSGTYECKNNIFPTTNLSSAHVLKLYGNEGDINYDNHFQKFWQIESSEKIF